MTTAGPRPDVILDVVFEDGLLYLALANIGSLPAVEVRCAFEQPLHGLGGKDVARSALFRRLEFLAPGREIRTLLDRSSDYFAGGGPTRVVATVRWRDREGRPYEATVAHDLEAYRDIAYVGGTP